MFARLGIVGGKASGIADAEEVVVVDIIRLGVGACRIAVVPKARYACFIALILLLCRFGPGMAWWNSAVW